MSSWRQWTCAVYAVCAVCAVSGRTLMLEYVEQRALCPLQVKLDVHATRIPRVIKTVRCAEPTGDSSCCGKNDPRHECTEVQDRVLVQYEHGPGRNVTTEEILVSVGCVCMKKEFGQAAPTPSPTR